MNQAVASNMFTQKETVLRQAGQTLSKEHDAPESNTWQQTAERFAGCGMGEIDN